VVKQLREAGKISQVMCVPQTSRFGIAANLEWEDYVRPIVAELIELNSGQVRLERAIEAKLIPQFFRNLPRINDGTSTTFIWCQEYYEDECFRLTVGPSYNGVPQIYFINYSDAHYRHYRNVSFRPLGVLA